MPDAIPSRNYGRATPTSSVKLPLLSLADLLCYSPQLASSQELPAPSDILRHIHHCELHSWGKQGSLETSSAIVEHTLLPHQTYMHSTWPS